MSIFSICVSLSVGLILGAVGGGVKKKLIKKDYTQKQIARNIKFISKAAGLLGVTCLVLLLGLLWCSYYPHTWHYGAKDGRICKQHVGVDCCCSERSSIMFAFVNLSEEKSEGVTDSL